MLSDTAFGLRLAETLGDAAFGLWLAATLSDAALGPRLGTTCSTFALLAAGLGDATGLLRYATGLSLSATRLAAVTDGV